MTLLEEVVHWGQRQPSWAGTLAVDAAAMAAWHEASGSFVARLASAEPQAVSARAEWRAQVRRVHVPFVRQHLQHILACANGSDLSARVRELGRSMTSLVATESELEQDAGRPLREKVGFEYKTALLLSELLAQPDAGQQLMDRARQPLPAALERFAVFETDGHVDLGGARIRREGPVAFVELSSPDALNAEDDFVLDALETCVDMALLDERVQVGVLRGAPVRNQKYAGKRVFCSGINLSALYEGRIPYLYYIKRELGLVSKLYRGLCFGATRANVEKPWIAAVDSHAIGGGCQLLLVMDYIVAERGSVLSLPARKEGIIPGAANLRLPRFIGDRAARRTLFMDQPIRLESTEGRYLVDEVVEADQIAGAVQVAADALLSAGAVSFAAHRKALRIAQEPVQQFREYMSHFALAQADCHFGPALLENLERNWLRNGVHAVRHQAARKR